MTGEAALALLRDREAKERAANAIMARSFERMIAIRDAFEDEGGMVIAWTTNGRRCCSLEINGERVAFGSSEQNSADAEAVAFQNLINERARAQKEER